MKKILIIYRGRWRAVKWLIQHGYERDESSYAILVQYHQDPLFLQWVRENWKKTAKD